MTDWNTEPKREPEEPTPEEESDLSIDEPVAGDSPDLDLQPSQEEPETEADQIEPPEEAEKAGQKPGTPFEPVKPKPPSAPIKKEPSRLRRFMVSAVRWLIGLAIVFSLGALLVLFVAYIPARQNLRAAQGELNLARQEVNSLQSELDQQQEQARQELEALQTEFSDEITQKDETISDLEAENTTLGEQLSEFELHTLILSAKADIAAARLALAQEEPDRVRVVLAQTPDTLSALAEQLPDDQASLVERMQDRLAQALEVLDTQAYASEADLEVIATSLMELENAYFSKPGQ